MFHYFRKRIFFFIPASLAMSLIVFGLSRLIPGDPVANLAQGKNGEIDPIEYQRTAARLGLDKPLFYFSISSAAYPDTLYQVLIKDHQNTLSNLISQYGNSEQVFDDFANIGQLGKALERIPDSLKSDATIDIKRAYSQLYIQHKDGPINSYLDNIQTSYSSESTELNSYLSQPIQALSDSYKRIPSQATPWKLYIPDVKWFGTNNQYHHWMTRFFKGDFGYSYRNGRPVSKRITEALGWTLTMNLLALLLVLLISIPLGVYSAVRKGSRFDRFTSVLLFMLYSMPNFWIATLFLVFLTTPEYSEYLDWFPSTGLGDTSPEIPFWNRFWDRAVHMVLPIICLSYGGLAYFSR